MIDTKYKINTQLETGRNSIVTRSRDSVKVSKAGSEKLYFLDLRDRAQQEALEQKRGVISSITNCGNFMHIVVLTYSWLQIQLKTDFINYVELQANLDKVRLMAPTDFFNLMDDYLKRPQSLKDASSLGVRCYGITKPKKKDNGEKDNGEKGPLPYSPIAHYFAILTDGISGVLYNAYGSDLTKNPGYSMEINLDDFSEFIEAINDQTDPPSPETKKIREDGYNNYFLGNEINYFDDEEGCIVKVGDRHEYNAFVLTEKNLKIYEIEKYQENVQKKLFELIKAPETSLPATVSPLTQSPARLSATTTTVSQQSERIGVQTRQTTAAETMAAETTAAETTAAVTTAAVQPLGGGKTPKGNPKRKSKRKSKRKKRSRRTRRRKRTKTRRRCKK
jgi:hypothetical protein